MASKEGKVEQTEKFIREWENHECMWNVHHPSYHNRDERTAAEKVIASIMDMTVKEVKNKTHNFSPSPRLPSPTVMHACTHASPRMKTQTFPE